MEGAATSSELGDMVGLIAKQALAIYSGSGECYERLEIAEIHP